MSALSPSFGVMAAIRGDIISALKRNSSPEESAKSISPSLSLVNQWSTQIPLLLSVDNSSSCVDLVFAIRKDLFQGLHHSQTTFGTLVAHLPEPFQLFLNFTRDIIAAQRNEKTVQKVRFLGFIIPFILTSNFSPQSVPEKSSRSLLLTMRRLRLKL